MNKLKQVNENCSNCCNSTKIENTHIRFYFGSTTKKKKKIGWNVFDVFLRWDEQNYEESTNLFSCTPLQVTQNYKKN